MLSSTTVEDLTLGLSGRFPQTTSQIWSLPDPATTVATANPGQGPNRKLTWMSLRRPIVLFPSGHTGIRQEGIHQHFYRGLRRRGKTGKVALVAVMRKLLLHLNAVAHRGKPSLPQEEVAI